MEKKRVIISFRITPSQDKALSALLAKSGMNKNKFFQSLIQKVLEKETNS